MRMRHNGDMGMRRNGDMGMRHNGDMGMRHNEDGNETGWWARNVVSFTQNDNG